MKANNKLLWVLQVVLGLYFVGVGITHFILPDGLPEPISWMYDLSDNLHLIAGTAEILGGLGLLLPGLTKIFPELTPLAAFGLVIVMIGAAAWHAGRQEFVNIGQNLLLAAVLAYVGYARWKLIPLPHRHQDGTEPGGTTGPLSA